MTTNVNSYSSRHLYFDNLKLVPVSTNYYPFDQEKYRDMWHVPGRTIMSTDALVTLANKKRVAISIVEQEGVSTSTTRLN